MIYLAKFTTISILLYSLFTTDSYAYLDPGTTAIIFQAIIGFFAAAGAFALAYWRKIKNYIKNKNLSSKPKK